eukprot:COSAG02_NODE_7726_length_2873_cov_8.636945_3_plen_104_part_00
MLWADSFNNCCLYHNAEACRWAGQPRRVVEGDVVGLMLDLEQQTLSVYLNGTRCGVMVSRQTKTSNGTAITPLGCPLRWAVDVGDGAAVRIERKGLPYALCQR